MSHMIFSTEWVLHHEAITCIPKSCVILVVEGGARVILGKLNSVYL